MLLSHMQDAGVRREAVGVELYGFQQQLARLQRGLAAANATAAAVAAERTAADKRVVELRRAGVTEATAAAAGQQKVLHLGPAGSHITRRREQGTCRRSMGKNENAHLPSQSRGDGQGKQHLDAWL